MLAELLLSEPLLTGETEISQLAMTLKLLGSPTSQDLVSLSALGCPDLIRWRKDDMSVGRPDNVGRRFEGMREGKEETIEFLKGLICWDPRARWTAVEALRGRAAVRQAREWWGGRPKAWEKQEVMKWIRDLEKGGRRGQEPQETSGTEDIGGENQGFVFDFEEAGHVKRPMKKLRID